MPLDATDRSPRSTASWLATVLGSGITTGLSSRNDDDFCNRLREVTFEALIFAIAAAGPDVARAGVTELYRCWVACAGPGSPHLFAAWYNLGAELAHAGDGGGAMLAYRNALAAWPNFATAAIKLAQLLEADGRVSEAITVLDSALQSDDARTALINQRGRLLEQSKRLQEAEQELQISLLIRPDQPDVIQHWLHIRQKQCHWGMLSDVIPGLSRDSLVRHSGPLSALALFDDVAQQRTVNDVWIQRKMVPVNERLSPPSGYRHDRIRLGYMSSDFCQHAMSLLIAELFERHDRSKFEVFGYCASPEDGSDTRQRVIAAFDHFTRIVDLTDELVARTIRADEIDILIDLNGLTSGTRLQALRWRPAPVQATYLGFVGPVPLPELDYMFCDSIVVPPEFAAEYRPAPLYVAEFYQANDSKRGRPAPRSRTQLGLPDRGFVFCCFSNHYKITEEMFAAWMEILRRVDHSVLWLIDDNVWSSANFADAARNAGIDPARIVSASRTSPLEYLAYLDAADLFLDTYPYNAGTIASDAIRMHLPLVTLSGQSFASRMAGRLLAALGAREGVAVSVDDYVEKAVALATDRNRYDAYKLRFTDDAWAATIGNIAKFTEQFERSLMSVVVRPPPVQYANDTMAGSDLAARSADESEVATDVPAHKTSRNESHLIGIPKH